MVDALRTKRIRGAGLDVTTPEPLPLDHPLITMDNVGKSFVAVSFNIVINNYLTHGSLRISWRHYSEEIVSLAPIMTIGSMVHFVNCYKLGLDMYYC